MPRIGLLASCLYRTEHVAYDCIAYTRGVVEAMPTVVSCHNYDDGSYHMMESTTTPVTYLPDILVKNSVSHIILEIHLTCKYFMQERL